MKERAQGKDEKEGLKGPRVQRASEKIYSSQRGKRRKERINR
jgi:hypothetical protein